VVRSAWDLLSYPDLDLARLATIWPELAEIDGAAAETLAAEGAYAGYLERQDAEIRAYRQEEGLALPADLDYRAIGSLSTEVREKLSAARPATLAAAARIPGVTPAAVAALMGHVRRGGGAR
jgi:tRNA uridine 5-carboxymethylaminomethyl modification enzyme